MHDCGGTFLTMMGTLVRNNSQNIVHIPIIRWKWCCLNVIDMNNYEIIDIVLFIAVNMCLENVMDYLLENIQDALPEIRNLILGHL